MFFGFMDFLFPVLFLAIFGLAFGTIVSTLVKNSKQEQKNNASPRLTCEATVVTKRTQVRGDHAHTTYFATFQFESGDRLEMQIPHDRFGYLVEGDRGNLSFQGTRFLGFERQ